MPIFEYRCRACESRFEMLLSQRDEAPPGCPECGSPQVDRMPSTFAVTRADGPAPSGRCRRGDCGCCWQ